MATIVKPAIIRQSVLKLVKQFKGKGLPKRVDKKTTNYRLNALAKAFKEEG